MNIENIDNETGEILPAETVSHDIVDVENLPLLSEQDGVIVFNKAAVHREIRPHQKAVREAAQELQEFISADPDLSNKEILNQLKAMLGNKADLQSALSAADKKRKGLKLIFKEGGDYIQSQFNTVKEVGEPVKKEGRELLNNYIAEQERIAQEAARKEQERINRIENRICFIRDLPNEYIGKSPFQIETAIYELECYTEDFQEFEEIGYGARKKTFEQLGKLLEQAELKEEHERIASEEEEAGKKKEAEDRAEFERQQKEMAINQEAANLTASVAKFVLSSSVDLKTEIGRIDQRYKDAPQALHEAAVNTIIALKSLIQAAEQREAVERQRQEQEAEQARLEAEKKAEEERKARAEAEAKAQEEREKKEAERKRYYDECRCEAEKLGLTCEESTESHSVFVSQYSEKTITINYGDQNVRDRISLFVKKERDHAEERKRLAEEAEARRQHDFGESHRAIKELFGNDVATSMLDAIMSNQIPHVTWSNE